MPTLHLGVIDLPYSNVVVRKKGKTPNATTGDVADILEAKYHVMEHFSELHGDDIALFMADALAGSLETLAMGGPAGDPFATAAGQTESLFKTFLATKTLERYGYPGVPTKAALKGVNHRFKHPYAKRDPRPSFIDTGLYQSSFKAWVD